MKKIVEIVCGLGNGGVESFLKNYIARLDKEKYSIDIITHGKSNKDTVNAFLKIGCKNIFEVTPKRKNIFKNIIELNKIIKSGNYDIVHSHMSINNAIPLYISKRCGIKKRISHSHQAKNESIFSPITSIEKRIINSCATDLVACGKEASVYLYGNNNDSIIIHNAIDINRFRFNLQARNTIRSQLKINNSDIIIGHIGRFTNQKNHVFLLDFFSKLPNNYKLLLIGDGPLKNDIIEFINKNKLIERVFVFENVQNVQDYMCAMDIFVLPSLYEGLPLVSIEAQTSGLPFLFSNTIDNDVKISDNSHQLPLITSEWVNAIKNQRIINNNRKENINEIIDRGYSIEKEVKKLEELYN